MNFSKPFTSKEEQDKLTCCAECTSNFEKEAVLLKSGHQKPSSLLLGSCNTKDMDKGSANLPGWLQPYGANTRHKDDLVELTRKWNRICRSMHNSSPNQIRRSYTCNSSYPWWPTRLDYNQLHDSSTIAFTEPSSKPSPHSNFATQFGNHQSCSIEFGFGNGIQKLNSMDLSLDSLKNTENKEMKITLSLGNSLSSDSVKLMDQKRERMIEPQDLSKLLLQNVPWQSETIPLIIEALINSKSTKKKGTWLLIQGNDWIGKRRLARGITESLFGSADHLIHMNMKRRENEAAPPSMLLTTALEKHEKCVVLIEDIDYADTHFIKFLADGLETRNFRTPIGRESSFSQVIFIMTTGGSPSHDHRDKNHDAVTQMKLLVRDTIPSSGAPNFDHKRKADRDLSNRTKNCRTDEKESASSIADDNGSNTMKCSRHLISNILDLNIQAEEEDEGQTNSITSVLTVETAKDLQIPHGFLESIEKRFVFDQNPAQLSKMTESFLSKIKGSFEEVCGSERVVSFSVAQVVLEEILIGCGSFLNILFEKWLKDVFQMSLESVKKGGKEETVELCFGDKCESGLEVGFLGSTLPKTIQIAFKD